MTCGDGMRCINGKSMCVREAMLACKAPLTPSYGVSSDPVHLVISDCEMVFEDAAEIAPGSLTTKWEVEPPERDTLPEVVQEEVVVKACLKETYFLLERGN